MTNTETTNEELKTHRAEHVIDGEIAEHDENCIFCRADNEGRQYLAYIELVGEEYATLEGCDEAYYGEYDSDEDFARDYADNIGAINQEVHWPYDCIDWEWAAREIMYDFSEQDGYYFSNN